MGKYIAIFLFVFEVVAFAEIAVVVGKSSSVSSISADEVKKIFTGKSKSLPDGTKAAPCDQAKGSDSRSKFYDTFAGMSAKKAMAKWSKIVFTGRGKAPKEVSGDSAMIDCVNENDGGIGYMDASAITGDVKVLQKK